VPPSGIEWRQEVGRSCLLMWELCLCKWEVDLCDAACGRQEASSQHVLVELLFARWRGVANVSK
jgi:hypothetical protein